MEALSAVAERKSNALFSMTPTSRTPSRGRDQIRPLKNEQTQTDLQLLEG